MNDTQRRNPHLGIDCPPWCRTDHAWEFGQACVGGGGGGDYVWTRAVRKADGFMVGVSALGPEEAGKSLYLGLDAHDAEQLAGIVELLADATPDEHRELAAAIRKAAADITGGT